MRKVCIATIAALLATAFVPTIPAQLPAPVNDLVCDVVPDVAGALGLTCQIATSATISSDVENILAQASDVATLTVQVFDQDGNPMATGGDNVTLATSAGTLSDVTDNGDGTYTATLGASGDNGQATVTGTLNGNAIDDDATVAFTCPGTHSFCSRLAGFTGFDHWSFTGSSAQPFTLFIDNIYGTNNIDLKAHVCPTATSTLGCKFNDDTGVCTNPPGPWGCPKFATTLPTDSDGDGIFWIRVSAYSSPGTFPGNYAGSLTVGGSDQTPTLTDGSG